MNSSKIFTAQQHETISRLINACNLGTLPQNVIKSIIKAIGNAKDLQEAFSLAELLIPEKYLLTAKELAAKQEGSKHVILSCYLKKEGL